MNEIQKGFYRLFDKVHMDNKMILDKFNRNFNLLKNGKDRNDYLNWILN